VENYGDPEDQNMDVCVMCETGGSLICCDACPAAFHIKCVGETKKTLMSSADWFCPECAELPEAFRRSGLAAQRARENPLLRVTPLGADAAGRVYWIVHVSIIV
jgi:hypothetical protein